MPSSWVAFGNAAFALVSWLLFLAVVATFAAWIFADRVTAQLVKWLLNKKLGYNTEVEWVSLRMPGFPGYVEVCSCQS